MKNLSRTIKQQKIMWITLLILLLASLLCHSLPKISDVNWQTILSLFSLMLVTHYFIHIKALDYLSQKIINLARTHRQVAQLLVLLAGFLAMFLTNDVAILSLIPLFLVIHKQVHGPFVFPLALITAFALLIVVLAGVLHFIQLIYTTIGISLAVLLINHLLFTKVDYGTLVTFIGFFLIDSGNFRKTKIGH